MITVLTPTYNRAYTLRNAYESLLAQTCKDFEWVIIDDGSNDNTEELVSNWMSECNEFDIRYFKQKNGGKHRAVNAGGEVAAYEYTLILDSDDYLTENAIERIHLWIDSLCETSGIVAVVGLIGYPNGKIVGGRPRRDYVDVTFAGRMKYGLKGDKAEVLKTEMFKKYAFPEFEGENFLRESASWDRIAKDGLKFRYFNEVIYICEYLPDGLTKTVDEKVYIKNFQGFTYCARLHCEVYGFPYKYIRIGYYNNVSKLIGKTDKEICDAINISRFSLLLGKIVYWANNLKNKIRTLVR